MSFSALPTCFKHNSVIYETILYLKLSEWPKYKTGSISVMQAVVMETCSGQQLLFSTRSFKNHKYLVSWTANTQVLLLRKHLAFFFPMKRFLSIWSSVLCWWQWSDFLLLKSTWSLWSPNTALLNASSAIVTEIHKTCKLQSTVCFLRKIRSTSFCGIYGKLNTVYVDFKLKSNEWKQVLWRLRLYPCISFYYAESEIWSLIW